MAAFWMVMVVGTGRIRRLRFFHIAVWLFVLWNIASVFWSIDVDSTVQHIITYSQLAGMVLILWDLSISPGALKAVLQAYVLGAYIAIGSTVINYLRGIEEDNLRFAATGFNANDLGLTLALGLPVAWYLAMSGTNSNKAHLLRLVNYAYFPAAILAILLTASRGSLVAAIPALFFVLASLSRPRLLHRVLILAILIAALFGVQTLVPQSSFQRLATIPSSIAEANIGDRVDIWREGVAVFSEHPLSGIGGRAFRAGVESGKFAHNTFLSILVEVGLIGFGLFAVILAIVVFQAIRHPRWEAAFWLTVLSVWAIGNSVHNWEDRKATWLFLSLVIVSAALVVRQAVSDQSETLPVKKIAMLH